MTHDHRFGQIFVFFFVSPIIAHWYQHPHMTRVVPGSNPAMKIDEFFYEYF